MRKVVISKKASNKLKRLLEYLETEWSLNVKKDFVKKLDRIINSNSKIP